MVSYKTEVLLDNSLNQANNSIENWDDYLDSVGDELFNDCTNSLKATYEDEEFGTVGIGTRSDFELFKKVNNDHDYRASDNNMLFCLNDKETIDRVIKIVVGYYLDGDYSYALERLIDLLEPKKKLDLKK